MTVEEADDVR